MAIKTIEGLETIENDRYYGTGHAIVSDKM